jgi:hypothetical protein
VALLLPQRSKLIPEILPFGLHAPSGSSRRSVIRPLDEAGDMVRGAARANLEILA